MAQTIKIFSKSLTDTDIKKRMAIPAKILPFLPDFNGSHAVKIHLIYGTRVWPIFCSIRKKGYKKPVFSSGWRKFVLSNNFNAGDELTLYKEQDEAGLFHYRVQVEKPARPSGDLSPCSHSLNHEVDENTGTSHTEAWNFQNEQKQLLEADAPIKHEETISEFPDVAADAPAAFFDNVIAKHPCRIFGANVSDEATGKSHFKSEHEESKVKIEKSSFCAMAGTSQAVGDAYYKSRTESEKLSLDLKLGLPTPYPGEVNLNLTLAPPIADGGN
ncbi:hypothetical protein DITRI_Ditri08aG0162500 [Diplodiscus trichospermus]